MAAAHLGRHRAHERPQAAVGREEHGQEGGQPGCHAGCDHPDAQGQAQQHCKHGEVCSSGWSLLA